LCCNAACVVSNMMDGFRGVGTGRVTRSCRAPRNHDGGMKASSGPTIGGPRIASTDDGKFLYNTDDLLPTISLSRSLASVIRSSFRLSDTVALVELVLSIPVGSWELGRDGALWLVRLWMARLLVSEGSSAR
jgi:hypothetical protein